MCIYFKQVTRGGVGVMKARVRVQLNVETVNGTKLVDDLPLLQLVDDGVGGTF